MKQEILTIHSSCDNLPLSVAMIYPEGDVKGIIQLVHGMAEHKERYFPFMEFLAEAGYATIMHDHRGHGDSVKAADDLGYFYDETGTYVVEDVRTVGAYAEQRFPGAPLYLFGHSMGALIVRVYLKKYDDTIKKLIVCGAPGKNPVVGVAKMLINVLKTFKGERNRSMLMYNLSLGPFNKTIENPRTPCDWLTVNEANVDAYLADPKSGFFFTLNGYQNLMCVMEECFKESGWGMKQKDVPIFFIAGSEDPCISGKKGWEESMEFLRGRGYSQVNGKLYEGYRHEILNETIFQQVYNDVLQFIEA